MSDAEILAAGACAHCGAVSARVADDGLRTRSQKDLLLARILGPRQFAEPRARPAAAWAEAPERMGGTGVERRRVIEARAAWTPRLPSGTCAAAARTPDELLGRVAQANRYGDAAPALGPLAAAREASQNGGVDDPADGPASPSWR